MYCKTAVWPLLHVESCVPRFVTLNPRRGSHWTLDIIGVLPLGLNLSSDWSKTLAVLWHCDINYCYMSQTIVALNPRRGSHWTSLLTDQSCWPFVTFLHWTLYHCSTRNHWTPHYWNSALELKPIIPLATVTLWHCDINYCDIEPPYAGSTDLSYYWSSA